MSLGSSSHRLARLAAHGVQRQAGVLPARRGVGLLQLSVGVCCVCSADGWGFEYLGSRVSTGRKAAGSSLSGLTRRAAPPSLSRAGSRMNSQGFQVEGGEPEAYHKRSASRTRLGGPMWEVSSGLGWEAGGLNHAGFTRAQSRQRAPPLCCRMCCAPDINGDLHSAAQGEG
jgi:hypothetical protein